MTIFQIHYFDTKGKTQPIASVSLMLRISFPTGLVPASSDLGGACSKLVTLNRKVLGSAGHRWIVR